MGSVSALDRAEVRLGQARGRYFRENFAQGGVDLVQIIPELVTNADAAVAASGRARGRIVLELATPEKQFLDLWRAQMRRLRSPALVSWRHELRCTDDGEGVDAELVDMRLGALGVSPPQAGQRGLFGRGLRDVWLAQGAGRIEGVRDWSAQWSRGSSPPRAMSPTRSCTSGTSWPRREIGWHSAWPSPGRVSRCRWPRRGCRRRAASGRWFPSSSSCARCSRIRHAICICSCPGRQLS